MKLYVVCFLLLLACMYPSLAQGSYEDCCLKYAKKPKPHILRKTVSYWIQKTDGGCNVNAVLFTFQRKNGKLLCADPKKAWVKTLMDTIDKNNNITRN